MCFLGIIYPSVISVKLMFFLRIKKLNTKINAYFHSHAIKKDSGHLYLRKILICDGFMGIQRVLLDFQNTDY